MIGEVADVARMRRGAGRADVRRAKPRNIEAGRNQRLPRRPMTSRRRRSCRSRALPPSSRRRAACRRPPVRGSGRRHPGSLGASSPSPSSARSAAGGLLAVVLAGRALEQRVLRQLLGDERLELEVAELQQLDRLLELRRHHQGLRFGGCLGEARGPWDRVSVTARSSRRDRGAGHFRRRPTPRECLRTAPGRRR